MTALMFEQRAIVALCRHTAVTEALALTSRADLPSEPRDQTYYKFVRRNQFLGDLLVLRDDRRLCIEHEHPAELGFERHKVEKQSVLFKGKLVHRTASRRYPKPASASGRKIRVDPARL